MKQFFQRIAKRVALAVFIIVLIITNIATGIFLAVKIGELNSKDQQVKDLEDKVQELQEDIKQLEDNSRNDRPTPTPTVSPTQTTDKTSDWKIYTNTKLKVSFKYPQSYEIEVNEQDSQYYLTIWDNINKNSNNPKGSIAMHFWTNTDGFLTKPKPSKFNNSESINIKDKNYKFTYYGDSTADECGTGSVTYGVIELSKTLYAGILTSESTMKCDNNGNVLPESKWTKTSYPSQELFDNAKLILQTITLL